MTAKSTIARLHYLTQDNVLGKTHADLAEAACKGGVQWIQFRTKNTPENELETTVRDVQNVARKYGAVLIINDNVALAKKIDADGVHLGKEDMGITQARAILGNDKIIGGTANNSADIIRLVAEGVDYIGLGPYRFTQTKKNLSPVLESDNITSLINLQNKVPVILIGGIVAADILDIAQKDAFGFAVSSAINLAADIEASAKLFSSETLKHFNR